MAATGNEVPLLSQLKALKDWFVTQLGGKAPSSHTHTLSQITDFNWVETDLASMQSQLFDIYARRNRLLWSGSQSSDTSTPMQLDVPTDTEFDYRQILVCTSNNIVIPCGVDDVGNVNGVATTIVGGSSLVLLSFWGNITSDVSADHFSATLVPNRTYMQFARLSTIIDGSVPGFTRKTYTITSIIGVA